LSPLQCPSMKIAYDCVLVKDFLPVQQLLIATL